MPEHGLHDHIGYWLRRLSDEVHGRFERQMSEHGVTVAQWNVLVSLYHGATAASEIARLIAIDAGAVSRLADRLIEKKLITRSPDPASRRRMRLALTPAGRTLTPVLIKLADDNDRKFFASLSRAQRQELFGLLRDLTLHSQMNPKGDSHV